ncbi:MAG: hypothetical protein V8R01_06400 [Bacilli bacterium]
MLNFNDGTSILRFDNKTKFNEYLKRDWVTDCYKIKNSENRLYVNGRCLSYCVDYISKRELMEEKIMVKELFEELKKEFQFSESFDEIIIHDPESMGKDDNEWIIELSVIMDSAIIFNLDNEGNAYDTYQLQ